MRLFQIWLCRPGVYLNPAFNRENTVTSICLSSGRCINGNQRTVQESQRGRLPCDGLSSHPGGSSNTPSHFVLGILWWTSILSRGSSNTPDHFMLGTLWWTSIIEGEQLYSWPQLFKSWIALSTGQNTIQWISIRETNCVIQWIEIYPVDSAIQLLDNWGLVTLYWMSCEGLASHLGRSSNAPSHFILGVLW